MVRALSEEGLVRVTLPPGWKGIVVLILPFTALAAIIVLALLNNQQNARLGDVVDATLQARTEINRASTQMLRAESGLRGYVDTGDEELLAPYHAIISRSNEELDNLSQLVGGDEVESGRLGSLRVLNQDAAAAMARALQYARSADRDPVRMRTLLDEERSAMSRLEAEFAKLQDDEDRLLADWAADSGPGLWFLFGVSGAVLLGVIGPVVAIKRFNSAVTAQPLPRNHAPAPTRAGPRPNPAGGPDERVQLEAKLQAVSEELRQRDRRLAESQKAYQEQNLVLQSLLLGLNDGIILLDRHGRVLVANPAAERVLGTVPRGCAPDDWSSAFGLYRPDRTTLCAAGELPVTRAMRGQSVDSEVFVRNGHRPEGVWIEFSGWSLGEGSTGPLGAVLILRDITAIKSLQQADAPGNNIPAQTEPLAQTIPADVALEATAVVPHKGDSAEDPVAVEPPLPAWDQPFDEALPAAEPPSLPASVDIPDPVSASLPGRKSDVLPAVTLVLDEPVEPERSRIEPLPAKESAAPAGPKPPTVLQVEDHSSNRALIQRILANHSGVKLVSAVQGRMGLDVARQLRPDVILLDLQLPDMRGDAVLRQLRTDPRTQNIPVAMFSADATPGQIDRLLAAGAQIYLTKPLDVKKLRAFLDEHLAKKLSASDVESTMPVS